MSYTVISVDELLDPKNYPGAMSSSKSSRERSRGNTRNFIAKATRGLCCAHCGIFPKFLGNLTWHHRDPNIKEMAISTNSRVGSNSYWKEIDKCDLLCVLCHRMVHGHLQPQTKRRINELRRVLRESNAILTY